MTWFHIMDDQASGRSAKVSSEAAADWVELEHRELPNSASPTMHKKPSSSSSNYFPLRLLLLRTRVGCKINQY